jgi:RNA polymerase sigma-70 factor (ECF subfamily)
MPASDQDGARAAFEAALVSLRPRLHRYCSRMMGTVFDGEDVTQDALGKAVVAFVAGARPERMEAWLMRIAHNAAIDALRRRAREAAEIAPAVDAETVADAGPTAEERQLAASSLRAFLDLTAAQRSAVILMDVLGYSLEEIAGMLHVTVTGLKATLHRGRAALRAAAARLEAPATPPLSPALKALYARYVDRFNARDFDAIRDMLAEEVWLDMVARTRMHGQAELRGKYLPNYGAAHDWRFVLGVVDGRPALLAHDPGDPAAKVAYFVELTWEGERVVRIRDFRYARYVTDGAEAHPLE